MKFSEMKIICVLDTILLYCIFLLIEKPESTKLCIKEAGNEMVKYKPVNGSH